MNCINYQMLTIQEAVNLSLEKMQGRMLAPHQEQSLATFMQQTEHVHLILPVAIANPNFMACYKAYTHPARRSGHYFTSTGNPAKVIEYMLSILCGAPQNISQHQSNLYLSLQGELLATLIEMRHPNHSVSSFLNKVLQLNVVDEIKYHYVLKILACCLGQTADQIDNSESVIVNKCKTILFSARYGPVLTPYITLMASTIDGQFNNLYDPLSLVSNLLQTQQNFLRIMKRSENEETRPACSHEKISLKIFQWEKLALNQWIKWNCQLVIKIIQATQANKKQTASSISVACSCLNMICHICQLASEDRLKNEEAQFYRTIKLIIIIDFLVIFFDDCTQYHTDSSIFPSLSAQFHAGMLKLLTDNPEILEQFLEFSPLQLEQKSLSRYSQLESYSVYIISSYQIYFIDFFQCPVGLSIKLMSMVTARTIDFYTKNFTIQGEAECVQDQFNRFYNAFFVGILFCKLVINENENQQFYEEEKDWPNFIADTLNAYFEDLATLMPQALSLHELVEEHPKPDIQRQKFYMFAELQENCRAKKMDELCEEFEREPIFEMLSNMFFFISFGDSEKRYSCFSNFGSSNNQKFEERLLFANMLPKLSCFITLVKRLQNYQIKSFFYYQIYQFSKELKVLSYDCSHKARLCKLFVLQSFLDEIIRDHFPVYGQQQSITFAYLNKELGISFEELVIEVTSEVASCFESSSREQPDCPQIVDYGLSILSRLCQLLTQRVEHLSGTEQNNKGIFKLYSSLMQKIFNTLKSMQIQSHIAYRKLFMISGFFINLNGVTILYNFYQKLQEQTLAIINHESNKATQILIVQKYLSGITGILEGLIHREIFKIAAQLFLTDIYHLKKIGLFEVDDLMEIQVDFLNSLLCQKIYGETQQSIGLQVHDLFINDLHHLINLARETEYEKKVMNLFRKMALTNDLLPLVQLPSIINLLSYPEVLDQYFQKIPRVQNLENLEPYACSRIEWLLSFMEEKIERDEKFYLNIDQIFLKFRMQKREKIEQLIIDICKMNEAPVEELKERVRGEFQNFDSLHNLDSLYEEEPDRSVRLWK